MPPTYDRDVLYTINISNRNSPTDPEVQIRFRFGKDAQNNTGVEISGLPDGGAPLVGPVETRLYPISGTSWICQPNTSR